MMNSLITRDLDTEIETKLVDYLSGDSNTVGVVYY